MTCTSSSWRTVTGTCRPSAWTKRVIRTFCAITPVRMIMLLNRGTRTIPGACSPSNLMRAPPGLVLPKGAAGTQPGASLRRYHPITPEGAAGLRQLNLHIDAGGEIELHQRVDRLRRRLHDIEQPFIGPHLKLLARLLVDVRRAVDGELLNSRRQRDRTADEISRPPCRVGDFAV